ncbi:hypothetical protein FRC07_005861 [Ceratobasidium sp. 392]|nr:hypothetical protein FRC07_005861 [Ceratobasidium sp. 392]
MSTTSSTDIINFVVNDAVSYLSPLVRDKQFDDAVDNMTDFFKVQGEIKTTASSLLTQGRTKAGTDPLLFYYLEQFESLLNSAKRGHMDNLDNFVQGARDLNLGIHDRLNKLYDAVTGQTESGNQENLLNIWHAEALKKLSDTGLLDYLIADYIDEIDEKLASIFALIRNGSPQVPFLFPSKVEYQRGTKFTRWKFNPSLEDGAVGLKCKSWRAASLGLKWDFEPGKTIERSFSTEEAKEMQEFGKTAFYKIAPFVDPEKPDVALVKIREVQSDYDVWGTWILTPPTSLPKHYYTGYGTCISATPSTLTANKNRETKEYEATRGELFGAKHRCSGRSAPGRKGWIPDELELSGSQADRAADGLMLSPLIGSPLKSTNTQDLPDGVSIRVVNLSACTNREFTDIPGNGGVVPNLPEQSVPAYREAEEGSNVITSLDENALLK